MKSRAETGVTKHHEPYVQLTYENNDTMILKAYLSPDMTKLRIVLPELVDMTQTRIDPDLHVIEFSRKSLRK